MAPNRFMDKLPPADKDGLASYLEQIAHDLRFQAEQERRQLDAQSRVDRHRAKIKDARTVLRGMLWQGIDTGRAIHMARTQTGIDSETLMQWAGKDTQKIVREKRNRSIMQKCATGWTNAQLAAHYGLAEKYVARIISRTRATAQTAPQHQSTTDHTP